MCLFVYMQSDLYHFSVSGQSEGRLRFPRQQVTNQIRNDFLYCINIQKGRNI